jgi:hypothetical protein
MAERKAIMGRHKGSYDGIGTWKRRPIRAGKRTYMPSHKRWGKITVTMMATPEGAITSTETWTATPEEVTPTVEDLELIEEQTIDTKGHPVKLIEKVANMIMMGGYAEQVAVDVIDLVTNWEEVTDEN